MSKLLPSGASFEAHHPMVLGIKDIPGRVSIVPGEEFAYQLKSGDPNGLKEERDGNIILLSGKGASSAGSAAINVSGNSISISGSGSTVVASNGRIVVNGVDVTDTIKGGNKAKGSENDLDLEITLPEGSGLVIGTSDNVFCKTPLGDVHLAIDQGKANVAFKAKIGSMSGQLTGKSKVSASSMEGNLTVSLTGQCELNIAKARLKMANITLTGQSDADISGEFGMVSASVTGQGDIKTRGAVSGSYTAMATGQADINHRGGVAGPINKSASGQADIDIR